MINKILSCTSIAVLLSFVFSNKAQAENKIPYKISCSNEDYSTLLEVLIENDAPKARLTDILLKIPNEVIKPKVVDTNIEFYMDASSIHIMSISQDDKGLVFSAQPSISKDTDWNGTLMINGSTYTLNCDIF